ncbi:RagB/SusD family nutrient uptake outer membrane protein [Aestuariibaculum marinum]|uniref:RagB/SusD family nutrient uptake outer membrane protein n=1 Tax=Aestuariibaculum marinum TaxID=2683592 RepID=A0A8J6PSQ3_9FLAO|nr:RagB/SusD family nutrient uptake outer membrane protein [Aestuariibaculum marinum]MBD0823237.1 RagB/SusD family nutrient uptake outer membrane protein [Aestuariibaculum marinum]
MKTKYIIYSIAVVTSLFASSCVSDDDLDQVSPNFETADSFWQDETDAIKGVNAAYASLLTDGTYMRSTPLLLDLKGDGTRSNSPWSAMANVGKFNTSISDASIYGWAFETYYQGIYRANQVLENVPGIEIEDANLKNRIIGQAYFLRGLYLFHAVNMFKNVPLPLTSLEIYHEQKTQEEGWAQVKSDFQMAVDLLPVSYNNVSGPDAGQKGRATKGAALSYLGKAHLFNHEYAEARAAFDEVIGLGVYDLVPDYRQNFTKENENNIESIFEVQFNREVGGVDLGWGGEPSSAWGKTSARAITYGPPTFGFSDVQPTWALFNEYQEELTVSGEIDPRLDATMFYNKPGMMLYGVEFSAHYAGNASYLNEIFCAKYQNSDGSQANEYDWRSGINERILRYADVLLMYAECLNELGQTASAYPYIQQVRDRVNLPDLATVKPGMTQQEMRDQIAHERFLEFSLEGHRFDDIRRWGWLQDPAKLEWLKSRDPEFNSYVAGREYFPIPQSEMDNNPLVTDQNDGY